MAFSQSLQSWFAVKLVILNWQAGLGLRELTPFVGALALVSVWHLRRLRGYAMAVTASILLILLGVWLLPVIVLTGLAMLLLALATLVVLGEVKVRMAFRAQAQFEARQGPSATEASFGRGLALASAVLALLSVAVAPVYQMPIAALSQASGPAAVVMAIVAWLFFSGIIASVMLGWLALWAMHCHRRNALRSGLGACSPPRSAL